MGRTTCLVLATSWCTRRTPRWDRQRNSTLRSRCSISRTRSKWTIHRSVSCVVVGLHAASRSLCGRWGKKLEEPHSLKSNEMAECSFQPQQPLVCDTFKNCEGLSRVAFMDGNGVVMLGKVVSCERKEEGSAGGKKK